MDPVRDLMIIGLAGPILVGSLLKICMAIVPYPMYLI